MAGEPTLRRKADALAVLRRAGIPEHTIEELDALLDDPVDIRRDADLLARHGITRDHLTDRMGGSP
jgi:hypothetical protein